MMEERFSLLCFQFVWLPRACRENLRQVACSEVSKTEDVQLQLDCLHTISFILANAGGLITQKDTKSELHVCRLFQQK